MSSGRTQTSSMSIISSSPLREGILTQAQEFVSLIKNLFISNHISFDSNQDSTIPRQFSRQIDPIPEYETDVIPNTLPTPGHNQQ